MVNLKMGIKIFSDEQENKKRLNLFEIAIFKNARGRNRTGTALRPRDFKSCKTIKNKSVTITCDRFVTRTEDSFHLKGRFA